MPKTTEKHQQLLSLIISEYEMKALERTNEMIQKFDQNPSLYILQEKLLPLFAHIALKHHHIDIPNNSIVDEDLLIEQLESVMQALHSTAKHPLDLHLQLQRMQLSENLENGELNEEQFYQSLLEQNHDLLKEQEVITGLLLESLVLEDVQQLNQSVGRIMSERLTHMLLCVPIQHRAQLANNYLQLFKMLKRDAKQLRKQFSAQALPELHRKAYVYWTQLEFL